MKIIVKILMLIIFVAFTTKLLTIWFLSPVWGDEVAGQKYEYWDDNFIEYNTVFIGSSRTYRGIIPKIFDSLTQKSIKTRSFNFGAPRFLGYEKFILLDNLINKGNLKYAFIELSSFSHIDPDLNNTIEDKYWPNIDYLIDAVKIGYFRSRSIWKYIENVNDLLESLMFSSYNLGMGIYQIEYILESSYKNNRVFIERNGYNLGIHKIEDKNELAVANKRQADIKTFYSNDQKIFGDHFAIYLNYLRNIISSAKEKGVGIFFYSMPKTPNTQSLLTYEYFKKYAPNQIIIDFSHYFDNIELYDLKYYADRGHLNHNGAVKLTKKFANVINKHYGETQ